MIKSFFTHAFAHAFVKAEVKWFKVGRNVEMYVEWGLLVHCTASKVIGIHKKTLMQQVEGAVCP